MYIMLSAMGGSQCRKRRAPKKAWWFFVSIFGTLFLFLMALLLGPYNTSVAPLVLLLV